MKTIGLLGGMSWESTVTYYRDINRAVKNALGGLHSAQIAMVSVDFSAIEKLQKAGDWPAAAKLLAAAAKKIEQAGADFLLICTNTMHKVADEIAHEIHIPLLHIADAVAEVLVGKQIKTVGLLGTAFTMEQDFYKGRLKDLHGLEVLVPNSEDRAIVHGVIYQELCQGIISAEAKKEYLRIIDVLAAQGAEAIILGCTEIGLLLQQEDTDILLYDTTTIHVQKAVAAALES